MSSPKKELGLLLTPADEEEMSDGYDADEVEEDEEADSEEMMALEEAMPKATPSQRQAMKRAIEACVAKARAGGYE